MPQSTAPLADDVYAVILAGGSGTRFWPRSRHLRPKQLCKIGGQPQTMIELTLSRLDGFIPPERRLIVTHKDQVPLTKELVAGKCAHVIAEPEAKNTANALALAALEVDALAKATGRARPVMISLHADHLIADVPAFRAALAESVGVAREGKLTLLGIVPESPETGFGYIERGPALAGHRGAYEVSSFREKPERKLAEQYVGSGKFYWNAGMFIWRVDVLMEELTKTLKPTVEKLTAARGTANLAAAYRDLPKISIDHAVLEVSRNVAVVPADIGWRDVGSWDALEKCFPVDDEGNLLVGDGCLIDSRNTTVDSDGPFVAALGLTDTVVVVSGGAVLVCPKNRAQDVKDVVAWLQSKGRPDLL